MSDINKIANDVTYLVKDIAVISSLVDRLDTTIDKLTVISSSVSSLLAVHEAKLDAHELATKNLIETVEIRRMETEDKFESLQERIFLGERQFSDKIDDQYDEIMKEIKEMRVEGNLYRQVLSERISTIEKWQWIVVGGSAVIGSILALIPWDKLF